MKLFVLSILIFTVVISCNAAPQISSEFVSEDDIAKKVIAKSLHTIETLADDNKIAKAVLKSIDQDCMLKSYKKHKLMSELTEESLDVTEAWGEKNMDPFLVFANIALSCSSKLDGLLGFAYENLFSYSGLLDTFREDEPFKKFIDDLVCYNNYAVKTNVLDPNDYSLLKYELVNQTQQECDEEITKLKEIVNDGLEFGASVVITDHAKCLSNELANTAEKFFLRYLLLVPLGLNEDQKKAVKVNFIADAREGLEKILSCNAEKTATSENEI